VTGAASFLRERDRAGLLATDPVERCMELPTRLGEFIRARLRRMVAKNLLTCGPTIWLLPTHNPQQSTGARIAFNGPDSKGRDHGHLHVSPFTRP
jgi:hypothetical protein